MIVGLACSDFGSAILSGEEILHLMIGKNDLFLVDI